MCVIVLYNIYGVELGHLPKKVMCCIAVNMNFINTFYFMIISSKMDIFCIYIRN